ncbi:DUF1996 domain-containing protein [Herbidospora cretacea]|uniref:DUF1996 domain-containing protein n=1 Tax=Herbidospora cretacea TaxID=28444 RepID=UPI000A877E2C|nr:DUF1996 domain-containing protein [Herbidospora cretacea]
MSLTITWARIAAIGVLILAMLTIVTQRAEAAPISQGKTATASSVEGGHVAANAVDGNAGSRWSSLFSDPQWLRVDFGAATAMNQVVLRWEAAYATAYQIQTSTDGTSWTTVVTRTAQTGGVQTINFTQTSARYIRVYTTARATAYGVSLWEFEVYGPGSGPAPSPSPTPTQPQGPIVRVSEFLADCPFTHRLPDDPIIYPGLAGASHMHSFFGNLTTNANSTVETLLAGDSNCNPRIDLSSYWVPTLYVNDQPVEPVITTFYYLGEGVRPDITAQIQPLPLGLRIVAGNAKATAPDSTTIARWSCLHANEAGASKDFVNCPAGTMLESYLDFPQCWDGVNLDSPDHKSHMAYPVNQACPSTHPVPVPKLRQVLRYPVNGDPSRIRLSSGRGFTMHGDFFNAWPEAEMWQRVRDCIRPVIKCGANGRP